MMCGSCSSTVTVAPVCASASAVSIPTGPAPTTITSCCSAMLDPLLAPVLSTELDSRKESPARDFGFLFGDELDERRPARLDRRERALQGGNDLSRVGHPLAVAAKRAGEGRVVAGDGRRRELF